MSPKLKKKLTRVLISAALFIVLFVIKRIGFLNGFPLEWILVAFAAAVYLFIGYDVLIHAAKNIVHGQIFDENFLMMIATFAAFGIGEYEEAVAVMVFYQLGEWFQDFAVGKSRKSVSDLMAITPEFANVEVDGVLTETDPEDVAIGDVFVVRPGEKIPIDGVVIEGDSMIDTSPITGESVPRTVRKDSEVVSGCVNVNGVIRVRATKRYEDSTVSRILELVENASSRKAKAEHFITRFAKYYTPAVTISAVLLALVPPIFFAQPWSEWIRRACTFLVISCPCAVVISVPLGFFGGIGASSSIGVLVKGSNYLELLAKVKTVAFDKTGTLTKGEFRVVSVVPAEGIDEERLLTAAVAAEQYSTHPIALSIRAHALETVGEVVSESAEEIAGQGIKAVVSGKIVYAGNKKLADSVPFTVPEEVPEGTVVYVAEEKEYLGMIVISDVIKEGAPEAIQKMKQSGVKRTVMLTGDRKAEAMRVARLTGVDEVRSDLLPQEKVEAVEALIGENGKDSYTAFVGDGINDAPVLMRSDVGIAMGSLGSDAAIEASDIVLMDDDLSKIAKTIAIARKTLRIVKQDIVLALGVKFVVLCLGGLGLASMWLAIFSDVGVAVLAILNSMRTLRVSGRRD